MRPEPSIRIGLGFLTAEADDGVAGAVERHVECAIAVEPGNRENRRRRRPPWCTRHDDASGGIHGSVGDDSGFRRPGTGPSEIAEREIEAGAVGVVSQRSAGCSNPFPGDDEPPEMIDRDGWRCSSKDETDDAGPIECWIQHAGQRHDRHRRSGDHRAAHPRERGAMQPRSRATSLSDFAFHRDLRT